jgi:hypothetical protein
MHASGSADSGFFSANGVHHRDMALYAGDPANKKGVVNTNTTPNVPALLKTGAMPERERPCDLVVPKWYYW